MENPFVTIWPRDGYFTITGNDRYGSGRAVRRRLLWTVRIPRRPDMTITDVLRAAADQLDLPPTERWQPPL